MKFFIKFIFLTISIFLFTACTNQSTTISKFNSTQLLNSLFAWQQEKYCPFEDELLTSEVRCNFLQVTVFEDGDPSNPEWYFRHDDKDFRKDKEISGLDLTMYSRFGKTFPTTKNEAEKYWIEATKFYSDKLEYTIESMLIDGKKAWKIMQYLDGEIPNIDGEISVSAGHKKHFSHIDGVYLIEKDKKIIYSIKVTLSSDSLEKVRAYEAEADHFISSMKWK